MRAFITTFWRLCLLQVAPQDLPYSRLLLAVLLAGHFLLGVALDLLGLSLTDALFSAAAGTASLVVLTNLVLAVGGHPRRANQTLSAMAGADLIIGGLALAATVLLHFQLDAPVLAAFVRLLLVLWSLVVTAHILRHALSVAFGWGMLIALGYMFVTFTILSTLRGPTG